MDGAVYAKVEELEQSVTSPLLNLQNNGLAEVKAECVTAVAPFQNFALNSGGKIVTTDMTQPEIYHAEDLLGLQTQGDQYNIEIIKLPDNRILRIYQDATTDKKLIVELVVFNTTTKTIDVITKHEQDFTGETDDYYKEPKHIGACFDILGNYIVVSHGSDGSLMYMSAFKLDGDSITLIATTDTYEDFRYYDDRRNIMLSSNGFGVSVCQSTNDIVFKVTDSTVEFTQLSTKANGTSSWYRQSTFEYNGKWYIGVNNSGDFVEVILDESDYTNTTLTLVSSSTNISALHVFIKDNKYYALKWDDDNGLIYTITNLDDFTTTSHQLFRKDLEGYYQYTTYYGDQHFEPKFAVIQVASNTYHLWANFYSNLRADLMQITVNEDDTLDVTKPNVSVYSGASSYNQYFVNMILSENNMTISYHVGYHTSSTNDTQKADFVNINSEYIGTAVNGFVTKAYNIGDIATIYSEEKTFNVPDLVAGTQYGDYVCTSEKQLIKKV